MAKSNYDALNDAYKAKSNGTPWSVGQAEKFNEDAVRRVLFDATIQNGGKLTADQVKDVITHNFNDLHWDKAYAWIRDDQYDNFYDQWYAANKQSLEDMISANANARAADSTTAVAKSLGMSYNIGDDSYQNYLSALNDATNSALGQQQSLINDELGYEENSMLRALALSQQQSEQDIFKRRQQAIKSGMSTAQLAAQEQNNLLAAQQAATALAQQYQDKRYETISNFANQRATSYMNNVNAAAQYTSSNQQALLNAYAGNYQADAYAKYNK